MTKLILAFRNFANVPKNVRGHVRYKEYINIYEGWNFNNGNYLFTTDTKQIHVSKFYCPSL